MGTLYARVYERVLDPTDSASSSWSSYVSRAHNLPAGSASQPVCSGGAASRSAPPPLQQLSVAPRSSSRTQLSCGAGESCGSAPPSYGPIAQVSK